MNPGEQVRPWAAFVASVATLTMVVLLVALIRDEAWALATTLCIPLTLVVLYLLGAKNILLEGFGAKGQVSSEQIQSEIEQSAASLARGDKRLQLEVETLLRRSVAIAHAQAAMGRHLTPDIDWSGDQPKIKWREVPELGVLPSNSDRTVP